MPESKSILLDFRQLARRISIVENEVDGYRMLLKELDFNKIAPVVGITGPPGAGKSTLVHALLSVWVKQNKKVAIIAVDPTSPFNFGALLGDRIRLAPFFEHANVFIRSLATRGSLGGLSHKIIEIADVVKTAGFDYVLVETVGVGQSEVEIAGLADTTVVAMVPEAGDEIQTMKAGLMEIADIFVVNKSDRPKATTFVQNLKKLVHQRPDNGWSIPVIPTVATTGEGIEELTQTIDQHLQSSVFSSRKPYLLTRKALQLIQQHRLKDVDEHALHRAILKSYQQDEFNLYAFAEQWF